MEYTWLFLIILMPALLLALVIIHGEQNVLNSWPEHLAVIIGFFVVGYYFLQTRTATFRGVLLKSIMMIMYSTISFTLAALVKTLQDLQMYEGTLVPEILFELFFIGGLVFLFLALRTIIAVMDKKTIGAV